MPQKTERKIVEKLKGIYTDRTNTVERISGGMIARTGEDEITLSLYTESPLIPKKFTIVFDDDERAISETSSQNGEYNLERRVVFTCSVSLDHARDIVELIQSALEIDLNADSGLNIQA